VTATGLVSAIAVGSAVGLLGRVVFPGRREAPAWLTVAVGVVATVAGTIAARLAGVDTGTPNPLTLIVQVGMAGVSVVLVVTTAGPARSDPT
jgi:uncharacterized membrane protein YeaQ/YmgE (transglycosylase-associated protein family)